MGLYNDFNWTLCKWNLKLVPLGLIYQRLTLTLSEYRTIWSAEVTLRWRTESRRHWSPATNFNSCLGRLFESTFRLAWLSTIVTSMSPNAIGRGLSVASGELVSIQLFFELVEYWGKAKKSAKSEGEDRPLLSGGCCCWGVVLLWDSRVWRSCSSSFTKLIAPPIIDAWSPCISRMVVHNWKRQKTEEKWQKDNEKKIRSWKCKKKRRSSYPFKSLDHNQISMWSSWQYTEFYFYFLITGCSNQHYDVRPQFKLHRMGGAVVYPPHYTV